MAISAELFQSLNPIFVVSLTPVIMAVFAAQRAKGKEPSTPRKIAIGMGIAATGFLIMAIGSYVSNLPMHKDIIALGTSPVKVTPLLLMVTYLILTVAELYILRWAFHSYPRWLLPNIRVSCRAVGSVLLPLVISCSLSVLSSTKVFLSG